MLIYRFKDSPMLVFFTCVLVSGIMEFVTGYVLFHVFNTRLWDYNTEIWNFGNIGGYICLRSVLFFGLSGLALIYMVIPIMIRLVEMADARLISIVSRCLAVLFVTDCVLYRILK